MGANGSPRGGVVRGKKARQRRFGGGGACARRVGANGAPGSRFQRWSGSPEGRNRCGEWRHGVGREGGASKGDGGVREEPRRPGGTPNGGTGGRWARKTAAAAVCQAPAELEVEDQLEELVFKL